MSNVVSLAEYREKRQARGDGIKGRDLSPEERPSFGPRLQQIRESLEKINKVMVTLKNMRDE